jgi:hypothetical protein
VTLPPSTKGDQSLRREAPRQEGDPVLVAGPEAHLGLRKGQHATAQAEPPIEDLRRARPLRWVVVKEHHALRDGHRPGRPREDRLVTQQLRDAEELEPIEQRGDVAPGDGQARDALEELRELLSVLEHGGAPERPHALLVVLADLAALSQVVDVELADRVDGGRVLRREDLGRRLALTDHVGGLELVLQADPIEVLLVAEQLLALSVLGVELRVGLPDLLGPGVELEVHGLLAEVLVELGVLALTLLPARGHGGQRRLPLLEAHGRDRVAQGGGKALRTEEHHRGFAGQTRGARLGTRAGRLGRWGHVDGARTIPRSAAAMVVHLPRAAASSPRRLHFAAGTGRVCPKMSR